MNGTKLLDILTETHFKNIDSKNNFHVISNYVFKLKHISYSTYNYLLNHSCFTYQLMNNLQSYEHLRFKFTVNNDFCLSALFINQETIYLSGVDYVKNYDVSIVTNSVFSFINPIILYDYFNFTYFHDLSNKVSSIENRYPIDVKLNKAIKTYKYSLKLSIENNNFYSVDSFNENLWESLKYKSISIEKIYKLFENKREDSSNKFLTKINTKILQNENFWMLNNYV